MRTLKKLLLCAVGTTAFLSCDRLDDLVGGNGNPTEDEGTIFENKSNLEPLVAIQPQFNFVEAYSLISSTDVLPDGFQFVGAADGAGFLKDPNSDGYLYVVNAEDNYAVARIELDANLTPTGGDWLLNSGVADFARQCSGTMWEASIHGGTQDLFLSASESFNYDIKGIDPYVSTPTPTADFGLDALGEFSWENAVPLPQAAYIGKTVIIGGDDDSSDSMGQITLYHSDNGDADLTGGDIYVMRILEMSDGQGGVTSAPADAIVDESMLDFGVSYAYEFVKIDEGATLTKDEMAITQIISGNTDTNNQDGNLAELQSPDNITVTENFIYLQEDPNSFDRGHAAYIYQSDLDGNNIKVVLELVVRQDLDPTGSTSFSGEYGALEDISDKVGVPDTFLLNLQPHYWQNDDFKGLDGHDFETRPEFGEGGREDNQGGQIVILRGLPR